MTTVVGHPGMFLQPMMSRPLVCRLSEPRYLLKVDRSGRRWEEIREIYLEQISGLEALQSQVQEGIESLKMESEHLQHVDDTIRRQREQLCNTFDEFERKQEIFNEKGLWSCLISFVP